VHARAAVLWQLPSRAGLVIDCEVCLSRHHRDPELTMVITDDASGEATTVRICRDCMGAIAMTMVGRYNEAVAANNAEVAEVCRWFGFEFPT